MVVQCFLSSESVCLKDLLKLEPFLLLDNPDRDSGNCMIGRNIASQLTNRLFAHAGHSKIPDLQLVASICCILAHAHCEFLHMVQLEEQPDLGNALYLPYVLYHNLHSQFSYTLYTYMTVLPVQKFKNSCVIAN